MSECTDLIYYQRNPDETLNKAIIMKMIKKDKSASKR